MVYVDKDPVAVLHSTLLLQDNPRCATIQADLREETAILESEPARSLLDLDEPIGVFMLLLLRFVPDSWDPVEIVARYRDRIVSGSYLALSHVAADADSPRLPEAVETYVSTQNRPYPRTYAEISRFFAGFELVYPGLVGCARWRPESVGDMSHRPEINSLLSAGVGRRL